MKFTRFYSRVAIPVDSGLKESKKRKKPKNNPWAICTTSVGRDSDKYEKCVQDIKKKNHQK